MSPLRVRGPLRKPLSVCLRRSGYFLDHMRRDAVADGFVEGSAVGMSRLLTTSPSGPDCRSLPRGETHRLPASLNLTRLACRSPTREQVFRTAPWLSVYVLFIHEGLRPFCESFLRVCQAKIHLSSARIFDNAGVTPKVLCSISVITRLRTQILHVTSHPMFSPRPRYLGQRIVLISGLAQRHLL